MQWKQPYEDEHFNLFCSDIMKNFTAADYLQKQISSASRFVRGNFHLSHEPDLPQWKQMRMS